MRSYLDLVPISAKIRRRQNRMSIVCIALAVFLVTAIFGMADMFVRSQILQAKQEDGNWHIMLRDLREEQAELLAVRPDIAHSSWYSTLNYHGEDGITIAGENAVICGSDESLLTNIYANQIIEGSFPKTDQEILVTEQMKEKLHLKLKDSVPIRTADGSSQSYSITGFIKNTAKLMEEDVYGAFLTSKAVHALEGEAAKDGVFFVQFADPSRARASIDDIQTQFQLSEKQVTENVKLLGLLGQSGSSFMQQMYGVAAVLAILVLAAGILMITSSLNSNVAQRTEFFGMIRCIGATPKQIMRLVRREALHWCKVAIPAGILLGIVLIWMLCFFLRYLSPVYFGAMPAFAVSFASVAAGVTAGMLTVLLAARAPAKRASKASPLAVVSGNASSLKPVKKAANTALFPMEAALGIHHAKASRKNFLLMAGSFSLSIVLFLSFTVTISFMQNSITPLRPWSPDLYLAAQKSTNTIAPSILKECRNNPSVERVYGRMYAPEIPVIIDGEPSKADLISYDSTQFEWSRNYLEQGSMKQAQKGNALLLVHQKGVSIQEGSVITFNGDGQKTTQTAAIDGILSSSPFSNSSKRIILICSEAMFSQLTGEKNYAVIDIQLNAQASETDITAISNLAGSSLIFSDRRLGNESAAGTYYAFALFIYGFLVLIALITIFNIVNVISMSVSARMKQYGVFRAIGLSSSQLFRMILSEALVYAITGGICGSIAGTFLHRLLFTRMITYQWAIAWTMPVTQLLLITGIVTVSVLLAVYAPAKRIRNLSIVDAINEK